MCSSDLFNTVVVLAGSYIFLIECRCREIMGDNETAAGSRLPRILFMRPHRVPKLSHALLQAVALVLLTISDPPVDLQGLSP